MCELADQCRKRWVGRVSHGRISENQRGDIPQCRKLDLPVQNERRKRRVWRHQFVCCELRWFGHRLPELWAVSEHWLQRVEFERVSSRALQRTDQVMKLGVCKNGHVIIPGRFNRCECRRAWARKYYSSPYWRRYHREYMRRWRKTEKGRACDAAM